MNRFLMTACLVAIVSISATGVSAHGDHTSWPSGGHEYTVKRGDTLAGIAADHLGSAARWREIARANGISDPRRLAVGTVLRLPAPSGRRDSIVPDVTDLSSRPQTEPLATAPDLRRKPEGANPSVIPPHPTHPAQEIGPTAYPQEAQEPLATARDLRRRHPRRHDLLPGRSTRRIEIGPTAYPAPAGRPSFLVQRRASRDREPLMTSRDLQRRYQEGRDLVAPRGERHRVIPSRQGRAFERNRGLTSFPVARQEVLVRPARSSGTPPSEREPGMTAYPLYDPDAVIAEGTLGGRWRAERWRP